MTEVTAISAQVAALLIHYFDLDGEIPEEWVAEWLANYPAHWLRLAAVEALYQGRYKAVSVEHILTMWQRRGQPLYHFNHEFERLVCSNFLQEVAGEVEVKASPTETPLSRLELVVMHANVPELSPASDSALAVEPAMETDVSSETVMDLPQLAVVEESAELSGDRTDLTLVLPPSATGTDDSSSTDEEPASEEAVSPIKYTDFYTKLKAAAEVRKKDERRRRRKEER